MSDVMKNLVQLTGRIATDLVIRSTKSKKEVVSFRLAVQYAAANGNRTSSFYACDVWDKRVQDLLKMTPKGSLIDLEGHLRVNEWTTKGKDLDTFAKWTMEAGIDVPEDIVKLMDATLGAQKRSAVVITISKATVLSTPRDGRKPA